MNFDMIPELIFTGKSSLLEVSVFWIFLFIPAFLLGGAFPVLSGIFLTDLEEGIRDTSTVYFFDTFGAAIGSIVAGFYLLPKFGINGALYAGIFFNFLFLILVSFFQKRNFHARVFLIILFISGILVSYTQKRDPEKQSSGEKPSEEQQQYVIDRRFGKVLFQENSDYGVVTVGVQDKKKGLYINYRAMCFERENMPSSASGTSSSVLSIETGDNLLSENSKVLNIGLGCGMTARHLSIHPNISDVDVIEINPVVYKAADLYFATENGSITKKNNVHIFIENGVDYITRTEKKYDAVVIDIEEVSVIYSSPLYTAEYMEIIKAKLTPHGVFSLWSFNVGPEFTRVLRNTASKVFEHVTVQYFRDAINIYASDRKLQITRDEMYETFAPAVDRLNLHDINTLGNRKLEKYYNSNKFFGLPVDYKEKFVRE